MELIILLWGSGFIILLAIITGILFFLIKPSYHGVTVENGREPHSFFVYMIDKAGYFRETFLPDSLPPDIASDLHLLFGEN